MVYTVMETQVTYALAVEGHSSTAMQLLEKEHSWQSATSIKGTMMMGQHLMMGQHHWASLGIIGHQLAEAATSC
jgi:hypothetical protein